MSEIQADRTQRALQVALRALDQLLALQHNCHDPDAECPMQDAHKPSDEVQIARREIIDALTGSHKWNIEEKDGELLVCRGDHHRSMGCEFEVYVRKESVQKIASTEYADLMHAHSTAKTQAIAALWALHRTQRVCTEVLGAAPPELIRDMRLRKVDGL
jgi:hypothetical protein